MALEKPLPYVVSLVVLLLSGGFAACRSSQASPDERDHATTNQTVRAEADAAAETEAGAAAVAEADAAAEAGAAAAADAGADAGFDGGDAEAEAPPPTCPAETIKIGRYCIDRWEGHLVVQGEGGATVPWPHHDKLDKGPHYIARSDPGFFPQAYISKVQATDACRHAGKRLCSRSEWMRACKGASKYRYPYGNKGRSGACNTGKAHLLEKFFGGSRRAWTYEIFNDPKLDQEPGFLGKSGQYTDCQSDEGTFDMVGNLHEWIADEVGEDIQEVLAKDEVERKEQPWRVGNGMFMGGFFSTTIEHGPGCTYTTIAHEPTYHDYSTGFRCCMDAPGLPPKKGKSKKKK